MDYLFLRAATPRPISCWLVRAACTSKKKAALAKSLSSRRPVGDDPKGASPKSGLFDCGHRAIAASELSLSRPNRSTTARCATRRPEKGTALAAPTPGLSIPKTWAGLDSPEVGRPAPKAESNPTPPISNRRFVWHRPVERGVRSGCPHRPGKVALRSRRRTREWPASLPQRRESRRRALSGTESLGGRNRSCSGKELLHGLLVG